LLMWLIISISSRLTSEIAIPLIIIVSPMPNTVSSICIVIPLDVGTLTLISTLLESRRLCAVIFQLPSIPLAGIPISFVEKAPVLSEKISVWLDMFPEGSKSVIVNLAFFPVFPIVKLIHLEKNGL